MTTSGNEFNAVAHGRAKAPPPFSLRLTLEERALLDRAASGMPVGAYVRERLFGAEATPRKTRGRKPIKDHEALGRVLAALGGSRLSQNLNQLARAVNTGSLPVTPETERDLIEACAAIALIRADLMQALGMRVGGEP